MENLRSKAKALLESGAVQVVIGYGPGSAAGRARAVFARKPEQAQQLIYDDSCQQNLATYLLKPEVRALGKAALVARPAALRTILQFAAENQLVDGALVLLAPDGNGTLAELTTFAALEEHVGRLPQGLSEADQQELDRLAALPLEQRWQFWSAEFARCMKCYACRAACPMCYCSRCIVENNQPQWIPVASDALGNLEWNVVRAMHLAGRCVDCGSCARACPEGIRIDLLNRLLAQEARTQFGAVAGCSVRREYALSTYKPDDKEDFIR